VNGGAYVENRDNRDNRPRRRGIGIMPAIAIALLFTILGTALGIHSAYNILPGTSFFTNSRLGQLVEEAKNTSRIEYVNTPVVGREGLTIPEIVDMVKPAVVTVSSTIVTGPSIFNPNGTPQESIGTGFILNEEGYIATNYHVIEGATDVKVILYTGEEVDATVINYDALADLAVIRISGDIEVPGVVTLGNSDTLRVGETAVAIGNPLAKEFAGTVTAGVISALDRTITIGNSSYKYIQIDAAINGGNSGGPLINGNGEVVGINSAKISDSNVEGIGFSIPINDLKSKLAILSQRALYVGIAGREINAATAQQRSLPEGILVLEIQAGSPAEKADLQINDVITKFDGTDVRTVSELNTLRDTKKAGEVAVLTVFREGSYIDVPVTLEERP
jgi:serine protease Do